MSEVQLYLLIVVAPFVLYLGAKLIFVAYFRAKAHYMRSLFDGKYDPPQGGDE